MGLSKQLVYLGDFYEEAKQLKNSWGVTNLFTTGHEELDKYLGGGFGRKDGYEIILIYGPTGLGKSTVALNFLAPAMLRGDKVGLLVLEDDMADVSVRIGQILSESQYAAVNRSRSILCLPHNALTKSWKLDDLLEYIENWFVTRNVDIILLDHLQFAFENAEAIRGENEYIAQRVFMQKLNQLMKRVKKTIILVSHVAKGNAKGMDKIVGSGSIPQSATKVIELYKGDVRDGVSFYMHKSRFTKTPGFPRDMKLKDGILETI